MRAQYGVKINSQEFKEMSWDEFSDLLCGLSPETPLGRMVQIRLETDEKIIENFTPHQKKIRSEWLSRRAKTITEEENNKFLDEMKQVFINMAK